MDRKGRFTPLSGSPWALPDDGGDCGGPCQTMDYSPTRQMLVTGGPNGVTAWLIADDGTLTVAPGSPASLPGADVNGTGVVDTGSSVYVYGSSFFGDAVVAFELATDGQLSPLTGAALPVNSLPVGLATRGNLVFVANQGTLFTDPPIDPFVPSSITAFAAQSDGSLVAAPGSPFAIPDVDFVFNVWPDVDGTRVYVYDDGIQTDGSVIHGWDVNPTTAALTSILDSPFVAFPDGPKAGLAIAKKILYAVDYDDGSNDLQPFKIKKKDGTLRDTGKIINSNLGILGFAIDPKGKRFIAASSTQMVSGKVKKKKGVIAGGELTSLPGVNPNALLIVQR
jgi:6-phosphogluconolactonase (cycloisomerase 2 family)